MNHSQCALALLLLTGASVATADTIPRFEVTPYVGYRGGGNYLSSTGDADFDTTTSFGVVANYKASFKTQWEVLYGHQETDISDGSAEAFDNTLDLNIDYLHVGGSYVFSTNKLAPFLSLTVGATRLSPNIPEIKSETYFSGSLGLGVRYDLTPNLGLRLEGRTIGIFGKTNSLVFCGTLEGESGCLFGGDGSYIPQFEVSAGLSFRFK
ncbi:MAG: outer membrane protein [Gammaproteobacteria bacterium]